MENARSSGSISNVNRHSTSYGGRAATSLEVFIFIFLFVAIWIFIAYSEYHRKPGTEHQVKD